MFCLQTHREGWLSWGQSDYTYSGMLWRTGGKRSSHVWQRSLIKHTTWVLSVFFAGNVQCLSFPTRICAFDMTGACVHHVQEAEEAESPKRSIRDSGYIDCWDSERSDSLSPPRHGREDSFDSLDSFGSRSRQTPSPDVLVARGSSDGRRWRSLHTPGSLKFTHNTTSVVQMYRESYGESDDPLKMMKKKLAGEICSVIVLCSCSSMSWWQEVSSVVSCGEQMCCTDKRAVLL